MRKGYERHFKFRLAESLLNSPLEDDLRDGVLGGVREREVRISRAERVEEGARVASELKRWSALFVRDDFDVVPREAVAPARTERFEGGLFGGEARCVVLHGDHAARVAVGALGFGEDALAKARGAREDFTHAPDFDNVYADGNYHD